MRNPFRVTRTPSTTWCDLIWFKTDAGRAEVQGRALVKERAQRNLLLLIDGVASEDKLLHEVTGVTAADFAALQALGLIVADRRVTVNRGATSAANRASPTAAAPAAPVDYAQFTKVLTELISRELGLRGFMLTLAVEKAATTQDLLAVAQRTLEQITERQGEAAALAARRLLFGG